MRINSAGAEIFSGDLKRQASIQEVLAHPAYQAVGRRRRIFSEDADTDGGAVPEPPLQGFMRSARAMIHRAPTKDGFTSIEAV